MRSYFVPVLVARWKKSARLFEDGLQERKLIRIEWAVYGRHGVLPELCAPRNRSPTSVLVPSCPYLWVSASQSRKSAATTLDARRISPHNMLNVREFLYWQKLPVAHAPVKLQ